MSRIIAGSAGGRRLQMPATDRTRPTTDRLREALFSALASWAGTSAEAPADQLAGLAFCDLYAGSGAVGLEAASRGAGPVLLVESDRRTAGTAAGNAATLGLDARVVTARVEQLLGQPAARPHDVLFADPPYELDSGVLGAVLAAAAAQGWLAGDGLVVLERSRRSVEPPWPPAWGDRWSRRYGETVLLFARPGTVGPP